MFEGSQKAAFVIDSFHTALCVESCPNTVAGAGEGNHA